MWLTRKKEEQQTFSGQAPFANATRRHLFKGLVGRTLCEHGHGQCRLGNEECFTRECVKRVSRRLLQFLLKGMNERRQMRQAVGHSEKLSVIAMLLLLVG